MALSEEIQDAITRHQINLLRYSAGKEIEAGEFIDKITREIVLRLQEGEISDMDLAKYAAFLEEIRQIAVDNYTQISLNIIDDAVKLIEAEIEWNGSLLSQLLGTDIVSPSEVNSQLAVLAGSLILGQAGSLFQQVASYRQVQVSRVLQTVQDGSTLRQPNRAIAESIKALNPLDKRQVGSLIRTISNHTAVRTRDLLLRENQSLFDGYEWVAVLDSRTSIICASRDGQVYPLTDDPIKSPKPPAHFSCRSTITPKLKAQYEGIIKQDKERTAEGAKGKTKVRASTTYQSWLKRQPASFQDEVLGKSRGKLFRNGGLELSKFVDLSGKTLTLDELRKIEPEVFNRVKL